MKKTLLLYGSSTGNTEELSQYVAEGLQEGGRLELTVARANGFRPETLAEYNCILMGCSTWYNGALQDDFQRFLDAAADVSLAGKQAAAFGPGDSRFSHFCEAVDLIEQRLRAQGAHLICDSLKVDGSVDRSAEQARQWGRLLRDKVAAT